MTDSEASESEAATLRGRALELHLLARQIKVMVGTLAERDLERGRAELDEAIAAIEHEDAPLWAIADWLRGIGIALESALYMGGVNSPGAPPVMELQIKLAAWFERG